jgi:Flp pilus assembly pilin Flp
MLSQIFTYLKARYGKQEEGQTLVEYVLIIVLVALAILVANPSLTSAIVAVFRSTSELLGAHTPTTGS